MLPASCFGGWGYPATFLYTGRGAVVMLIGAHEAGLHYVAGKGVCES